ncbi:hypothetical protein KC19_1G195400 [Ceratodon purpureus]|uniref:Uncharacterized protein n=1 Tax=Ceratodon purpureus TaxID=3225 RepID=A0A8T0J986_CERPU|nr:hypothetical protein KC19_1G195400 [Ceratodon purpureus]
MPPDSFHCWLVKCVNTFLYYVPFSVLDHVIEKSVDILKQRCACHMCCGSSLFDSVMATIWSGRFHFIAVAKGIAGIFLVLNRYPSPRKDPSPILYVSQNIFISTKS